MKNICGLSSRVVANQERVILVRVRYIDSSSMEITEIEQRKIRGPDDPVIFHCEFAEHFQLMQISHNVVFFTKDFSIEGIFFSGLLRLL